MQREVAVTGLGWVTSIGCDGASVLHSLRHSRSGIRPVDWFPGAEDNPVKVAGTVPEFDVSSHAWPLWKYPGQYTLRRDALRSLPPHGIYALCATLQALEDAGLAESEISSPRTGLFCASAGSPMLMRRHLSQIDASSGARGHPLGVVSSISGTLNFNLGAYFKIKGANMGVVSACASSSHAVAYAMEEIRSGRQERMIVVGAEEVNAETLVPFAAMRALSPSAGPDASCPFDRRRDGFVGTGGAVTLILESTALAHSRSARLRALARGWGQASDGHNIAISREDGDGLARAMENALADAALAPRDIAYINAHATSTPVGDLSETRALARVFADHPDVPVSSTKALTGHALSMAGALEAAVTCLCLEDSFIPPQAHLREPDPGCAKLHLPTAPLALGGEYALSNSSGFGGSNVTLVFRRADA
ncbi:MAG: beta-ketoacyl-[acyl-carrier-protein] synthase family protein [Opitutales bacterium]|nr:beta-ketoacyl-[acyl-carrier-protein] synthase family protein [Opitutales bacterium]